MAKTFGLLSVLAIAGALLCVLVAILVLKDNKVTTFTWYSGRALFAGGLYSVLFTFFFYTSPLERSLCSVEGTECKAGPGAIITALNSVLVAVLAILAVLTQSPTTSTKEEATEDNKQADRQIDNSGSWFGSDNSKVAQDSQNAVASPNSNNQKRGWFSSKSSKVAAGAAVAGGAVVATRAVSTADNDEETKSQRGMFGRKQTRNKSMTIEPVDDEEAGSTSWFGQTTQESKEVEVAASEKKRGWFGSKSGKVATGAAAAGGAAAAVAATRSADNDEESQSQRSLFGRKKTQAKEPTTKAVEGEAASSSWFGSEEPKEDSETKEKTRGWFGSKSSKVAAGGTMAAATSNQRMENNSERSLFGPKESEQIAKEIEAAEKKKRSILATIFRPKAKAETKEPEVSPTADTRRALFGSDADSATTEPNSTVLAKQTKSKPAQSRDETVVSNEVVSSSCPPCYCLP